MKHLILIVLCSAALLYAAADKETNEIVELYKKGDFTDVCDLGMQYYFNHSEKEPHFVAMVGIACAKADMINWLGVLQRHLVDTPALRSTATFFTVLLMDKRLLYQHFVDGVPVDGYRFPVYDHVLSVVMEGMSRGAYEVDDNKTASITTKEGKIEIRLTDDTPPKLLIIERNATDILRTHWYR